MKYFVAVAALAAVASALPLDFQPSLNADHPAFSSFDKGLRIVGAMEVPAHEVPYQVGLFMGDNFCGGSLINDRYILTSAQCAILSSRPVIVLGAHRIKEKEPEQLTFVAQKVITHPHWEKFVNDVALVMLPQNIKFTKAIQPIKLAPSNSSMFENELVRVTGWGITSDGEKELSSVLRFIINPILPNRNCEQRFGIRMFQGQMCLSGEKGRSPCRGDGGAPAIAKWNDEFIQAGIVSFMVEKQCEKGYPVGMTRVSYYFNWIRSNM